LPMVRALSKTRTGQGVCDDDNGCGRICTRDRKDMTDMFGEGKMRIKNETVITGRGSRRN